MGSRSESLPDDRLQEREALVDRVDAEVRASGGRTGIPRLSDGVRRALLAVPRHAFVPEAFGDRAYANQPLPIGQGQTISQPLIVAIMTELAEIEADDRVLEVGTGCGYQTAVLARLAAQVYSVELSPELAAEARQRLARLGFDDLDIRCGDGARGWPEAAPFDAILVTAAAREVPPAWIDQLAPGGRLVVPVGPPDAEQTLTRIRREADGRCSRRALLPVAFVPLREADAREA